MDCEGGNEAGNGRILKGMRGRRDRRAKDEGVGSEQSVGCCLTPFNSRVTLHLTERHRKRLARSKSNLGLPLWSTVTINFPVMPCI